MEIHEKKRNPPPLNIENVQVSLRSCHQNAILGDGLNKICYIYSNGFFYWDQIHEICYFFLYKMIIYQLILTFRSSESINPSRKLRLDHFVIDFQLIDTVGDPNHAF